MVHVLLSLLPALCSAAMLLTGVGLGWLLKTHRSRRLGLDERRMRSSLLQLQELASSVADDVGHHTSKLEELSRELVSPGAVGVPSERAVNDAIGQIVALNNKLQGKLSSIEQQLGEQATQLNCRFTDARVDMLTALPNRQAFEDELNRRFAEWQRTGAAFTLVAIEIDNFSRIAQETDVDTVNPVLQDIAHALDATMREMDLVARYGPGQFALLLPATKLPEATRAAERARLAIEATCAKRADLRLHASVGVAEAQAADNGRSLLRRATSALSVAKEAGGQCGYFHDGSVSHPILNSSSNSPALRGPEVPAAAPRNNHYAQYVAALNVDARTDVLTGLPNRRAFSDEIRRAVVESHQNGRPLSLLVVGIDNLSRLSSRQGQGAVDQVLRKMAQVICAMVRDTDLVTRYGWEEFAIILPGTTLREATNASQRVLTALGACEVQLDHAADVTISSGVTTLESDDDAVSLCRRADEQLQAARLNGLQCVRFHSPDLGDMILPLQPTPMS